LKEGSDLGIIVFVAETEGLGSGITICNESSRGSSKKSPCIAIVIAFNQRPVGIGEAETLSATFSRCM
jgi:hypothetical protein